MHPYIKLLRAFENSVILQPIFKMHLDIIPLHSLTDDNWRDFFSKAVMNEADNTLLMNKLEQLFTVCENAKKIAVEKVQQTQNFNSCLYQVMLRVKAYTLESINLLQVAAKFPDDLANLTTTIELLKFHPVNKNFDCYLFLMFINSIGNTPHYALLFDDIIPNSQREQSLEGMRKILKGFLQSYAIHHNFQNLSLNNIYIDSTFLIRAQTSWLNIFKTFITAVEKQRQETLPCSYDPKVPKDRQPYMNSVIGEGRQLLRY